jgi:poly(A) polymerase
MSLHQRILTILSASGHEAYIVGGHVRDSLLHRTSKDIDIATAATPDQVLALFPGSERIGAHFGVTLIKEGAEAIEVATFRLDGAYSDSRRPDSVAFTTDFREDVKRRDFTVNALAMDIAGNIHDLVDGSKDLRDRKIVAIGDPDVRFHEDPVRMLRAVRFACQLHFIIEDRTFASILRNAHLIKNVSAERVQKELNSILTSGAAARGIELLLQAGLLTLILPEICAMIGVDQNPTYHPEGDVYIHTLALLSQLEAGCSLTLALAALLHDVGKPAAADVKDGQPTFYAHEDVGAEMVGPILSRLKYSSEVIDVVSSHVEQHMRFREVQNMRQAKLYRFIRQPNFTELLALHRLDSLAGCGSLEHAEFVESVLAEVPLEAIHPERLLTGRDLIEFGITPGPRFRVLLDALETEQLEGRVATRMGALCFIGGLNQSQ